MRPARTRYLLLTAATVAAALAGYTGYLVYPRFDLPRGAGGGLLLLAAAAGIASFFSPCSFPLLLSVLARAPGGAGKGGTGRALGYAAALAAGAASFLLLAGVVVAVAGTALFAGVTFTSIVGRLIRAVVGVGLLLLGLIQLGRLPVSFRRLEPAIHGLLRQQAGLRRRRPLLGHAMFGFGYVLAGFGWTGPVLAGLAGQVLTSGGGSTALLAFAVAATAMVVLLFALAALLATTQQRATTALANSGPTVKRWGGWILLLVGAWFLVLAVFARTFAGLYPV